MNTQEWILDQLEGKTKGEVLWALLSSLEQGKFEAFWTALPQQYKTAIIMAGAGEIAKVFPAAAPYLTLAEAVVTPAGP